MINNKEKDIETIENTLLHFPEDISDEIHDYTINEVLKKSRYIFTTRKGRKQYGYCTHCKNEYETRKLKHKTKMGCPECRSICEVRASGYSRKNMIDEAYFVYYEKSEINNEAVIARGFEVSMDFSGDYKNVKPQYKVAARYLFEMNNPIFLKTNFYWFSESEKIELRKSVFTLFKEYGMFGMPTDLNQKVSIESIRKAVKGTKFQYSEWDNYKTVELEDYVKFFALYARYPQIEYLKKLGFEQFVIRKLCNATTYRTINWRGKTLDKVLKIDKQNIKEVVKNARSLDPFILKMYQLGRKDGSNLSIQEVTSLKCQGLEYEFGNIEKTMKKTKLRKLINYLQKQLEKSQDEEAESRETDPFEHIASHRTLQSVFMLLQDYWDGCRRLELEAGNDIVEYPSNLQVAHDNVFDQIEFKENQEIDKKIKVRLKDLPAYENELFILRPFESTEEIIQEGKELKHCVGRYSDDYASGEIDLYVIRKKDKPEESYYTLEVSKGMVRQCRGYRNKQKTKEIEELLSGFERDILNINNEEEIAS